MTTVTSTTIEKTFDLTTNHDDDTQCACPDCDEDPTTGLSLVLAGDIRGMAADYAEVGFCSIKCAREFLELERLHEVDDDIIIHWDEPVAATICIDGTYYHALGHDLGMATRRAAEVVDSVSDSLEAEEVSITYDRLELNR